MPAPCSQWNASPATIRFAKPSIPWSPHSSSAFSTGCTRILTKRVCWSSCARWKTPGSLPWMPPGIFLPKRKISTARTVHASRTRAGNASIFTVPSRRSLSVPPTKRWCRGDRNSSSHRTDHRREGWGRERCRVGLGGTRTLKDRK